VRGAEAIAQLLAAGALPCLAYLVVGLRVLPRTGLEARGAERLAFAWIFGTGIASLAILGLRALGVPLPLLAAGAVVVLLSPRLAPRARAAAPRARAPALARAADAGALLLGALTFLSALGPETFWDGFEYHLPLVAAWTEGRLRAVPGLLDAEFRAGVDLLAVPALTSGEPDAAAAVSAGFALALAALVRGEAARRASPAAGALAGLFTLAAPLVVELAPSSYVDLGVGAYGFAALACADRWNRGGAPALLLSAAACLGFALNAKLHAALLFPAAAALVWLGGRRPPAALAARSAGLAGLVAAPWFLKVWLTTGNPFFPFLVDWLGSGPTDARNLSLRRARLAANYPVARDLPGLLQWLASTCFGRNPHVGGLLGPLPLALAPLAAGRLARPTWALLAVLAPLVLLQFSAMPALRFGTPVWPWLAVAAAAGGHRLAASGAGARAGLAALLALVLTHQGVAAASFHLPRIAALRDPRAYEAARFPDQDALRRMVAQAEPVVGIPMGAVAWMPKPVYNLLWERNGELYFGGGAPAELPLTPPERALTLLRERGVRSLVIDAAPPHPADGRVGHPVVDAWLAAGHAALAPEVEPLPARQGRRWVLVRLR
jgi:hypothetical protein